MSDGWILIHRQICDNDYLWDDKPFSRGQAWIDLIMAAEIADVYSQKHGITVERGQLIVKLRDLADRWGWSKSKVFDFLNSLRSAGMAKIEADNKRTLLTIANYSKFQDRQDTSRTRKGHAPDTKRTPTLFNKEYKEDTSCQDSPSGESDDKTDFKNNALLAADYMAKKIETHTPNFPYLKNGKRNSTIQRWANDIEKLLRIDKVDFSEFKKVLQFSQTDTFWKKNILSGEKLRAQYGTLLVQISEKEND